MKQTNRLGEFKRIQKVLVISSKRSVRDSLPITRNLPRAPKFFPCLPLKVSSAKELSDQPVQQRFCFTFFHGFFLCSHWFIFVHPFHHYPLNVYNRLCSRRFYASLGFFFREMVDRNYTGAMKSEESFRSFFATVQNEVISS